MNKKNKVVSGGLQMSKLRLVVSENGVSCEEVLSWYGTCGPKWVKMANHGTFHSKGGGSGCGVASGLPQTAGEHRRHPSGLGERFGLAVIITAAVWNLLSVGALNGLNVGGKIQKKLGDMKKVGRYEKSDHCH